MDSNLIFSTIKEILCTYKKDISNVAFIKNKFDYTIKFFDSVSIKFSIGKNTYIYVKTSVQDQLLNISYEKLKSKSNWLRIPIYSEQDIWKLAELFISIYDSVVVSDPFGCCSSFIQCSDARQCIRTDLRAKACIYRNQNLEKGKIFYGKNKNI